MESRAFIKAAGLLINKIKDVEIASGFGDYDADRKAREEVQKELNQLFTGLGNPTLPSAYKLRDAAVEHEYLVDQRVMHRLSQFENL